MVGVVAGLFGGKTPPEPVLSSRVLGTLGAKTGFTFDGQNSTIASFTDGCNGKHVANMRWQNCEFPMPAGTNMPDWPADRFHLNVIGNKNLTIQNLRIDGGKNRAGYVDDYEFQHGIRITGGDDGTTISNVSIDHVWGDYVNIAAHRTSHGTFYPKNVRIVQSHFGLDRPYMGAGRQGIAINEVDTLHVEHSVIQYSSRSAVDIEPVSAHSVLRRIYFDNNVFGEHANNLLANHPYGDKHDPVIDGIYFRNNRLRKSTLRVDAVVQNMDNINAKDPRTFRRRNYHFINNYSDQETATRGCPDGHFSIRLWGIDGVVIQGNTQPFTEGRCMHLFEGAKIRDARVIGNKSRGAISTTKRYFESWNVCERDNYVGTRLTPDHSGKAPRCK